MKIAGWVLTFFLAAVSLSATMLLPPAGNSQSAVWTHVAPRYIHQSAEETGWAQGFFAVLSDYRSFDLLALVLIFAVSALACGVSISPFPAWKNIVFLLGPVLGLSLGFFCLGKGSNFLDYEPLSEVVGSLVARRAGAWILGLSFLFSLAGLGLAFGAAWNVFQRAGHDKS